MTTAALQAQPLAAADEASARDLLDLATSALQARRLAEVAELELAIQWGVVNGHPADERDPMVTPGGDGTPAVREHAIPELAMARETHPATTRALIADGLVLDLVDLAQAVDVVADAVVDLEDLDHGLLRRSERTVGEVPGP